MINISKLNYIKEIQENSMSYLKSFSIYIGNAINMNTVVVFFLIFIILIIAILLYNIIIYLNKIKENKKANNNNKNIIMKYIYAIILLISKNYINLLFFIHKKYKNIKKNSNNIKIMLLFWLFVIILMCFTIVFLKIFSKICINLYFNFTIYFTLKFILIFLMTFFGFTNIFLFLWLILSRVNWNFKGENLYVSSYLHEGASLCYLFHDNFITENIVIKFIVNNLYNNFNNKNLWYNIFSKKSYKKKTLNKNLENEFKIYNNYNIVYNSLIFYDIKNYFFFLINISPFIFLYSIPWFIFNLCFIIFKLLFDSFEEEEYHTIDYTFLNLFFRGLAPLFDDCEDDLCYPKGYDYKVIYFNIEYIMDKNYNNGINYEEYSNSPGIQTYNDFKLNFKKTFLLNRKIFILLAILTILIYLIINIHIYFFYYKNPTTLIKICVGKYKVPFKINSKLLFAEIKSMGPHKHFYSKITFGSDKSSNIKDFNCLMGYTHSKKENIFINMKNLKGKSKSQYISIKKITDIVEENLVKLIKGSMVTEHGLNIETIYGDTKICQKIVKEYLNLSKDTLSIESEKLIESIESVSSISTSIIKSLVILSTINNIFF